MSLQVSGWVFSTWCLMVEVCHLLEIIITFFNVLDQTSLMVLLKIFSPWHLVLPNVYKNHFILLRSRGNSWCLTKTIKLKCSKMSVLSKLPTLLSILQWLQAKTCTYHFMCHSPFVSSHARGHLSTVQESSSPASMNNALNPRNQDRQWFKSISILFYCLVKSSLKNRIKQEHTKTFYGTGWKSLFWNHIKDWKATFTLLVVFRCFL